MYRSKIILILVVEVTLTYEMLVSTDRTARCHDPEDHNLNTHSLGYLKRYTFIQCFLS
jgi:hypothetical protein